MKTTCNQNTEQEVNNPPIRNSRLPPRTNTMKWNKQNKEKLCLLLRGADYDKLKGLGIETTDTSSSGKASRNHVLIPIVVNKSLLIRYYLAKYHELAIGKIRAKIKSDFMIDVSPALVATVKTASKGVPFATATGSSNTGWSPFLMGSGWAICLKIPKDVAEKFLVLGVP